MTASTLQHVYQPRGACKDLFSYRGPEVLLSGPAGTGKSRACLEKLNAVALANGGVRGLIVRKTATSLTSTALVTWRQHVIPELEQAGVVEYYGGSSSEPPQYRYINGSRIMIGGMDKATRIMSSEYDIIYVQEAIELSLTDWESLTTRLRNGRVSFQQLLADTNPDAPTHWLKVRVDSGATAMYESRHADNPVLYDDEGALTEPGAAYISRLDGLTGVRHARLRRGLWLAAEGMVYEEEWDPSVHVIDRFAIPSDWTRWWTVDFGFVHPFVLQCWAEDPDGRLYMYREIYHTKRLVEDHAKRIMEIVRDEEGRWLEPRPRAIICDHDAEDRATLERHLGLTTVAAKKSVSDGIQAVASRMRAAGDGKPRIFLLRDSVVDRDAEQFEMRKPTSTVDEVAGYVWDTSSGRKAKEAPVKEDDDGCDAMRYMVAQRDLQKRSGVRWL